MIDTQPPTSDHESKRSELSFAISLVLTEYEDNPNKVEDLTNKLLARADEYSHQEVNAALDISQHRMLKKNEELVIEAKIEENMYYWHRQRALHKAAKDGVVSMIFLDRKASLEAQLKNKEGVKT